MQTQCDVKNQRHFSLKQINKYLVISVIKLWFCVSFLTGVDGDGEALHGGDGERSEQRADADVDQDVRLTDPRREVQHENRTQNQHHGHVHQEA